MNPKLKKTMFGNEEGASAVEFALILPLFLILVFGLIEFSVIMFDKAVVTNASREGVRFGVLFNPSPHTDAQIRAKANEYLEGGLSLINLGGNSTLPPPDIDRKGDLLTVTVEYPYDFLFLPGSLTLSGKTTMRMEQ